MALPVTLAAMLPSLGQIGMVGSEERKRKRQQFIMKEAELIQGRTKRSFSVPKTWFL